MSNRPKSSSPDIPLAEWIVALLGLFIVGGLVVFLLREAVAGDRSLPRIRVTVESIVPSGDVFLAKFNAFNEGGETAAQVIIEGTLTREGSEPESSEVTLAFVPSRSARGGGLFFQSDPRGGTLALRAKGYEEP